jgi:hypothetical protein
MNVDSNKTVIACPGKGVGNMLIEYINEDMSKSK